MIVLISLAIIILLIWIIFSVMAFIDDVVEGFLFLFVGFITALIIDLFILSPVLVLDRSSGMTIGTITSVDKNYWGSTAIYLKTSETTQEKYCAENEDIIEFAKNHIGKKVRIGYGERIGIYKLSQCDQAPIEHIEIWEE